MMLSMVLLGGVMAAYFVVVHHVLYQARSDEHAKACTDPNYFKTRDDLLKENAELKAQLYIEKHKTEYR